MSSPSSDQDSVYEVGGLISFTTMMWPKSHTNYDNDISVSGFSMIRYKNHGMEGNYVKKLRTIYTVYITDISTVLGGNVINFS